MLKYLLTFELLHCKYQYLQILVVYGQMLALFTSAVGFYDHLFAWNHGTQIWFLRKTKKCGKI